MKSYNKKRKPKHSLMTGLVEYGKFEGGNMTYVKKRLNISSKKISKVICVIRKSLDEFGKIKLRNYKESINIKAYKCKYNPFDK